MHECVFSDKIRRPKVTTLDMAKRLMDYGFHPPTVYFPLVVPGAIMIEPTETESKEDIDLFIDAMKRIAAEAEENPEIAARRAPQEQGPPTRRDHRGPQTLSDGLKGSRLAKALRVRSAGSR